MSRTYFLSVRRKIAQLKIFSLFQGTNEHQTPRVRCVPDCRAMMQQSQCTGVNCRTRMLGTTFKEAIRHLIPKLRTSKSSANIWSWKHLTTSWSITTSIFRVWALFRLLQGHSAPPQGLLRPHRATQLRFMCFWDSIRSVRHSSAEVLQAGMGMLPLCVSIWSLGAMPATDTRQTFPRRRAGGCREMSPEGCGLGLQPLSKRFKMQGALELTAS